jgi:inactivated superfamily I helicase
VDQWIVFSGFDKNESSRKSKFREMKRALPHAQAYLDLNEIHARQLAALKQGELPSGRGATPEKAAAALHENLGAFLNEKYKPLEAEAQEFQKATNHGTNTKKVLELALVIRKRLDAIPAPTGAPYDAPVATPTASSTPQPTAAPNK